MATPPARIGLRSERGPILISLMLSTGLVAIDSTVIATAVPSIVANLGGFTQFPWLFSIYLLAQAVSVPIYGKLADLIGRKPVMLIGIGLFLLGSVLCAAAWSMPALIAFRALQGLGAGAVQPMSLTIAGDIYTVAERGKVQGYLASVWAASAVIGPTLGGLFSEYLSWRWIFVVNVPLCLIAMLALTRNFSEQVTGAGTRWTTGRRAVGRRVRPGHARAARRGRGLAVVVGAGRRRARRWAGAAGHPGAGGAPPASRCCRRGCPAADPGRQQPHRGQPRRGAARAHLVRADVRPRGARHRPAGRRLRAGHADVGWPVTASQVEPGLPAHRVPGRPR